MKLLWMIPCLALCACMNNTRGHENMYDAPYQEPMPAPYAAPSAPVAATSVNPYALQPAAYEDNNYAINQKEQELFNKEKDLLAGQQELYEREKKLANREADFINRSKALDYKEKSIVEGRSYAPVATSAPAPVTPQAAQPAQQPNYTVPVNAPPVRVYYAQPAPQPMPQPAPAPVMQPVPAPQSAPTVSESVYVSQETVTETEGYTGYSEPASYEPAEAGFIIMQHPIQRDLVRCPATDDVCLLSYERLGYVRSANLSRFTAQDELNVQGTYPTNTAGQWRENNSIPRW